jgi:hypothetical protein
MKNIFVIILVLFCFPMTYAQIGIKANNTPPIPSAQLEVQSTTKAFYPPRMTTTQRTTMPSSPLEGAIVYDTDLNGLFTYNGSSWVSNNGFTLPYSATQSSSSNLISLENTSTTVNSSTILAQTNTVNGAGAVTGFANNITPTGDPSGVRGINYSTNSNGYGIYGEHYGGGRGVYGASSSGAGGFFTSSSGYALITGAGNVGLGISVPLERLHVSGNIRASSLAGTGSRDVRADANGNLTAAVRTKYFSTSNLAFIQENTNGSSVANYFSGAVYASIPLGTLKCPLYLPHGATITNARIYYSDNDATNDLTFSVQRTNLPNSGGIYGTNQSSSGSSASVLSIDIPLSFTVDNLSNTYFITVTPKAGGSVWANSTSLSVRSVVITYTE